MADRRWAVVATVREPLDLVLAFACHHLDMGAEVTLFFDDPDDPAADVLEQLDRVRVIRCDATHWAAMGWDRRPDIQTPRQNTNFRWAVSQGLADWLIHLDADEFLWAPHGIWDEVDALGPADWLAVPPWERVLTPGDTDLFSGAFRGVLEGDLAEVYGDEAPFLAPKGLAGYASSKPMVPARTPHHTVTHRVMGPDGPRPKRRTETMRVLHFEGLTPTHWALKHLRYAAQSDRRILMRPARYAALREIIAAPNVTAAALGRFDRTYRLTEGTLGALTTRGALHRPPLDIAGAVARIAPHVSFDPTGARLDRALAPRLAAVAADVTARRDALLAVPLPR
ncbi:MAG: glycosyltransferase family 2 protein [Pseudomonadota bacterium]|nr:glycosyltransferase family 2 protein [Pseudomonadota bacterium]